MRRFALPPLLRFLLSHCLIGAGIGLGGAIAIVWFDVAGIGRLVSTSSHQGWIAIALLCFGFMVTFGSLAMGSAIFMLGSNAADRDESGDGHRTGIARMPIRVPAVIRRRRR